MTRAAQGSRRWNCTLDEAKEWLNYDPATGVFTWLKRSRHTRVGWTAGVESRGYVILSLFACSVMAHRAAFFFMTGNWPALFVDHIDRDRSNNAWENLREVTNKQNHENMPLQKNNKSGHAGVGWDSDRSKWYAHITHHQRMIHIGRYDTLEEAVASREIMRNRLFTHHTSQ